jgi:hypothetical protein
MFGTIFEKIQTLLSRTYWLGNFFPVFVFALLNLALAWIGIDGFADWLASKWRDATVLSAVPLFGLISVGILAFVLAPLIPVLRAALEGQFLPRATRETLTAEFALKAQALQDEVRVAKDAYVFFDQTNSQARTNFAAARNAVGPRNNLTPLTYETAQTAFDALMADVNARRTQRTYSARLPAVARVTAAVTTLAVALRQYPMEPAGNPVPQIADALDDMQRQLQDTLQFAKEIADRNLQQAEADFRTSFVATDIRPTRIANARAAMEQYPTVAYMADYDFLWPRLRMVLTKDQPIADAVETASAQLDFAVLMTALAAVTAVAWLVVLAFFGNSIVLYYIVGIGLPVIVIFFYRLVGETQRAFGGVMEMAVDGLRFHLLTALRQPLPSSLDAEQRTWLELQIGLYSGLGTGIRYRHPKP